MRYTGDAGSNKSSLEPVCRWASILRSELSSSRAKAQRYRNEAQRLQKSQADATKRVLEAESSSAEYKSRVHQLQAELAAVLRASASSNDNHNTSDQSVAASPTLPSNPMTPVTLAPPQPTGSGFAALGLKSCLRYIDMSTPEIASLSPSTDTCTENGIKPSKVCGFCGFRKFSKNHALTLCCNLNVSNLD